MHHSTKIKVYALKFQTLFLFSNKMLIFRVRTHKVLVRTANREDPDLTASSDSGSALFI